MSLTTSGHEKHNATVSLTAAATGSKKLPYIVFKGKGKTAEDRELKTRSDIVVAFSDSGWFNANLTVDWLNRVMEALAFSPSLLIWDSYRCHLYPEVEEQRQKMKIHTAVIPGGCTSLIQAPDVSWNKVFKSSMQTQYDEWLAHGPKTYTAAGNIWAVSKTQLCDMIVVAWQSLTPDLIARSSECCGQVPGVSADKITCFKDGHLAEAGMRELECLYGMSPFMKVIWRQISKSR